jgi:hypothetical protein
MTRSIRKASFDVTHTMYVARGVESLPRAGGGWGGGRGGGGAGGAAAGGGGGGGWGGGGGGGGQEMTPRARQRPDAARDVCNARNVKAGLADRLRHDFPFPYCWFVLF